MSLAIEMLLGCLFISYTTSFAYVFLVIAIIYAIGMLLYEINNKLRVIYIILSLICSSLLFVAGSIRYNTFSEDRNYIDKIEEGDAITFQGKLAKKEKKTTSYYLYFNNIITNDQALDSSEAIILQSDSDDIPIGAIVVVEGSKVQFNVARNEGNFDEKSYYNSIGVLMKVKWNAEVMEEPLLGVGEFLYGVRESIKQSFISNLPGEEAGIISAMVLGDKSELDVDAKDLFKLSGLAHILAISGLHISIVGMSIYRLLRKRGMAFLVAGVISSFIVILYGMLTFGGVSTIRAVVMFLVMILADILGEGYDSLSAIGASMVYILFMYPYCVNSVGFIFSFGAVIGIAVIVNPLVAMYDRYCRMRYLYQGRNRINKVDNKVGVFYNSAFLSRIMCGFNTSGLKSGGLRDGSSNPGGPRASGYKPSIKERMCKALLSGVLIQLVTLPIVCIFYYEIPTYVVLLNCLVIPLLGVLLGVSLFGGIVVAIGDFLSGAILAIGFCLGKCFEFLGSILLWASHFIIYMYEMLAFYFLQLPFARIVTGEPGINKVVIYYLVLVFVARLVLYKYEDMEKVFEAKQNMAYESVGVERRTDLKNSEFNYRNRTSSKNSELNYKNRTRGNVNKEKNKQGIIIRSLHIILRKLHTIIRSMHAIFQYIKNKRYLIICGAVLLAGVLFITYNHNYDDFEMDMVDVGQGDGILVVGDNNYFFDGGSTDVKNVGKYRILPFLKYKGIRHIDYWFVSHVDSDHISGLIEALDAGYSISNIVVDKYMLEEENYRDIDILANDKGVNLIVMKKGDVVSDDNLKFTCVFAGSDEINDINGNSLGILGEYIEEDRNVKFFIGGDMTVDSEKYLLEDASEGVVDYRNHDTLANSGDFYNYDTSTSSGDSRYNSYSKSDDVILDNSYKSSEFSLGDMLADIDILKLSHHGSKSSSSEEFLKMLSPKMSLISAGVNNRYHHPSHEVIERLDELGIPHMCTQDYGRLRIYLDEGGVNVVGFLR